MIKIDQTPMSDTFTIRHLSHSYSYYEAGVPLSQ